MKQLCFVLIALFAFVTVKANDGAFYSEGNQLIPINETSIKVQKEILTITRIPTGEDLHRFSVNVYYEFFNPGPAKDLLVGFEAANYAEGGATHPYIHDFKVVMNSQELPHEVTRIFYPLDKEGYVDWGKMEGYYKNGRFVEPTQEMWNALKDENSPYYVWDDAPYYYVYHFNAHFNEGLNIIQHTYDFNGSDLVGEKYLFDYVLTAANRWANNGIDDFTLEINMGNCESFSIQPTFFQNADEWTFNGKGKVSEREGMIMICENCPLFHVQSGSLVFHKKNFHPEGELHITRDGLYLYDFDYDNSKPEESFNSIINGFKAQYYNLNLEDASFVNDRASFTAEQRRILKNIPFAYRGYVFVDQGLQSYFNSTKWYIPNPEYKADMTIMSENEKAWIMYWAN